MKKDTEFVDMLLDVIACKWTRHLLTSIMEGTNRPGKLQSQLTGISTKVMNESLVRLVNYGFLTRHDYDEIPLRVEYEITPLGKEALDVITQVQRLKERYLHIK
jgi:DNA-binding HxlR family transcriptional regulator